MKRAGTVIGTRMLSGRTKFFVFAVIVQVGVLGGAIANAAPATEAARVKAFLDARYTVKDVHHSFRTKFGETIDCIDFFAQPGVKAMAAMGSPITTLPGPAARPNIPAGFEDVFFTGTPDDQGKPRACPAGSVPVMRITTDRISAADGLDAFVKAHQKRGGSAGSGPPPPSDDLTNYAHIYQQYTGGGLISKNYAMLNIQKPLVLYPPDHSIMQTWTTNGGIDAAYSTVELGSIVSPAVNGDRNPHFFIFATNNNYGNGCYNNVGGGCLAWIGAPSAYITPGMTLTTSVYGGLQQNWTVNVQNGNLGYGASGWNIVGAGVYPSTDFPGQMATRASTFSIGGEVYDATHSWYVPMGSGAAASAGYGQAGYWYVPAPGAGGAYVDGSGWNYTFSAPSSERPTAYSASVSSGYAFVGPTEKTFDSSNYGFEWSQVGDWAYGNYKAQCDNAHGITMKGVATNVSGTSTHAIACGDYINRLYSASCYPRSFATGDNRGSNLINWDSGYVKGECGYAEIVGGIAQSTSGTLNTILCCPDDIPDHSSCQVELFNSSNSASYGSGPDWAPGYYKGVCPVGKVIVGISRKSSGAAHAILCCYGQ